MGSGPEPRWGLCPQTSTLTMSPRTVVLDPPLFIAATIPTDALCPRLKHFQITLTSEHVAGLVEFQLPLSCKVVDKNGFGAPDFFAEGYRPNAGFGHAFSLTAEHVAGLAEFRSVSSEGS